MKTLYKWQRTTLWIIGFLTFISVTANTLGKEFNIGYFFDLIFGVGLNILVLFMIFKVGNWIYETIKKKEVKDEK